MTELLAPAGNIECAYAAIHSGADAIYLGTQAFSARASAQNFDEESLGNLLCYAKLLGVKVYVAMNTLVKDEELPTFLNTLVKVWNLGVDAVILQDVALGAYIAKTYPEICLHLSTQAGVCNVAGAEFAKKCGFSRVILARETPYKEIEKIAKIVETEVFVQGALCTCLSGQCYFSSFVGGNSGNRGRCKQPCRKQYAFNRTGYEEKSYAISPADLCIGKEIEKLKDAGVVSFKIEGRMRRAEYVAAATDYYRNLLDGNGDNAEKLSALKRTYNRGNYTKGLGFGQDKTFLSSKIQGHLGEKVGVVKVENKKYLVDSVYTPNSGDAFKILRKGKEVGGAFFAERTRKGFSVASSQKLQAGDVVFLTTDTALNAKLLDRKKTRKIALSLRFIEGERAQVSGEGIEFIADFCLESAKNKPLTKEEVCACFLKTDGLPLEVCFDEVEVRGNIFVPKSQLNEFRRNFYAKFVDNSCPKRNLTVVPYTIFTKTATKKGYKGVIARDFSCISGADLAIYKPCDYAVALDKSFLDFVGQKYLYCPAFCDSDELKKIFAIVEENGLDGVYAENFSAYFEAHKRGVSCILGTGFNITNSLSAEFWEESSAIYFVLSKELSMKESAPLLRYSKATPFVSGDLKLMDLCYCPFEKTCANCDKKTEYTMTDEVGREFPVRRYKIGGNCRFEIYNGARYVARGNEMGLADCTMTKDVAAAFAAWDDEEKQKKLQPNYTYGHAKNGVL